MNYPEMVDALANMSEHERQATIRTHWQAVLSDGFVAFVQGQMEAARSMASGSGGFGGLLGVLSGDAGRVLQQQALYRAHALSVVWDSMDTIYRKLQAESERQGNNRGMVAHGHHRTMPAGRDVTAAAGCYRCGASAVSKGLCSGCLATEENWEVDALRHDQQQWDNFQNDLRNQQLRDDQIYRDHQQDFNSYQPPPDYSSYSSYSSDY